jgi:hypothetical protein
MAYGDKPFGLRDVKLTNLAGTTQVDLPVSRTLSFKERIKSGELEGDDALVSVVGFAQATEWKLESGGISLEAYAMLTGRTVATAGASPNETKTLTGSAGDIMPYIKIYGKVISEDADSDIHCKLFKAKTLNIEGEFKNGEFFVTKCDGIAVDDGTNGIWEFVQNETAAALPGS